MARSNNTNRTGIISGRHIFAVLIALFAIAGGYAAYNLISTQVEYNTAQNEYNELRRLSPFTIYPPALIVDIEDDTEPAAESGSQSVIIPDNIADLKAINPDFIGWILIDGTVIDYPVVQSTNNTKYLNITFTGEQNPSGTIFMDHLCPDGFNGFTLLHGHNMRNGTMFGGLHQFLNNDFRAEHSDIIIFSPDTELLTYHIFYAKLTDIYDEVFELPGKGPDVIAEYFSSHGFTENDLLTGTDILVLATCTANSKNERLLVFATNQHP